ncbi:MotB family protein [Hyphomicrobium sp. 99]|uniref:MotB family protein n=1 Tax=Hyphomicrobium sp. 99 TaxID=1163419 RepID=UPI0005F78B26|nr:MotB family protein [Hyphomicrobium sp. 99]
MSNGQEDVSSQPLVIVRRRRNTDEPHHGGVWKIAYADFMTAMMAFFLVMWLINAADKKTIVQVAAYFNPMRLTDRFAAPKGLEDLTETATKPSEERGKKGFEKQVVDPQQTKQAEQESKEKSGDAMDEAAQKSSAAAGGKSSEAQKEQALFDNPGDLLEKLADEARANSPTTASSPADGNVSDPFDRTNRRAGKSQATLKPLPQPAPTSPVKSNDKAKAAVAPENSKALFPEATKQTPPVPPAQSQLASPKQLDVAAKQAPAALDQLKKEDKTHDQDKQKDKDKDEEAKKLEDDISKAISDVARDLPHVEVKATPEGVLISLTDDAHFGMFEVGSAKPRPELVLVMEKIGGVLGDHNGTIVVRGHTDSRAYKNANYDNWRLSAARAQMAYYMLVRSGIPETRVTAIEGRADRDPKIPSDTLAAQNRRIDILIKEAQK